MLRHVLAGFAAAALLGSAAHATSPGLGFMAARLPTSVPGRVLLVHEGHGAAAQATGTVNAVDAAQHKVNLSQGAIKTLGWPAMTMDFPVSPDADLAAVKPGMRVNFTLIRGDGGMVVDSIRPAGSGQ